MRMLSGLGNLGALEGGAMIAPSYGVQNIVDRVYEQFKPMRVEWPYAKGSCTKIWFRNECYRRALDAYGSLQTGKLTDPAVDALVNTLEGAVNTKQQSLPADAKELASMHAGVVVIDTSLGSYAVVDPTKGPVMQPSTGLNVPSAAIGAGAGFLVSKLFNK